MAITGTGVQADPYVVTTYGELVAVAKTSETYTGAYIKIDNDINITKNMLTYTGLAKLLALFFAF